MSIRAHIITKLEYSSYPSFIVTNDPEIMILLGDLIYPQLDDNCTGYFELERNDLKQARKEALKQETIDTIDVILKAMGTSDSLAFMAF